MIVKVGTKDFQTLVDVKNVLRAHVEVLSDSELDLFSDYQDLIVKMVLSDKKEAQNYYRCKKYRESHQEQVREYRRKYYYNVVKPKREAKRKEKQNAKTK